MVGLNVVVLSLDIRTENIAMNGAGIYSILSKVQTLISFCG